VAGGGVSEFSTYDKLRENKAVRDYLGALADC
jgi:hypothetical protein